MNHYACIPYITLFSIILIPRQLGKYNMMITFLLECVQSIVIYGDQASNLLAYVIYQTFWRTVWKVVQDPLKKF